MLVTHQPSAPKLSAPGMTTEHMLLLPCCHDAGTTCSAPKPAHIWTGTPSVVFTGQTFRTYARCCQGEGEHSGVACCQGGRHRLPRFRGRIVHVHGSLAWLLAIGAACSYSSSNIHLVACRVLRHARLPPVPCWPHGLRPLWLQPQGGTEGGACALRPRPRWRQHLAGRVQAAVTRRACLHMSQSCLL